MYIYIYIYICYLLKPFSQVYLADDAAGAAKSQVGADLAVGTHATILEHETGVRDTLVVYTKSSLAEQTTPASLDVADVAASVSMSILSFTDQDLDGGELGGFLQWIAPADSSQVAYYQAYAATDAVGTGRDIRGSHLSNTTCRRHVYFKRGE